MRKSKILLAIMMIAAMLVGCGGKEVVEEVVMKEFASTDGTCSIQLNEEWITEDTGMENWIAAFSEDESEGAMVMQFTKGIMDGNIAGISDLIAVVEESYVMSGSKAIDVDCPALNNVEAYSCTMDVDGLNSDGCVAYGETDYAYYVIISLENGGATEKAIANFQKSCNSFKETV